MIINFVGLPRSGKTLDAMQKVIDNLKIGRVVYTNIEGLDTDSCRMALQLKSGLDDMQFSIQFHWMNERQSMTFWRIAPHNSLIVLDEVHKLFNARDWKENAVIIREAGDWASTHGHEGYDVVFISQYAEKVDKQLRELAEFCFMYKKNNFMGSMFESTYFRYAYMDFSSEGRPLGKPSKHFYDKSLFPCYKSRVNASIKEMKIMKLPNILNHWVIWITPFLIGLCIYLIFYKSSLGTGDLFGIKAMTKKKPVVSTLAMGSSNALNKVFIAPVGAVNRQESPLVPAPKTSQVFAEGVGKSSLDVCRQVCESKAGGHCYVVKRCSSPSRIVHEVDGKVDNVRYITSDSRENRLTLPALPAVSSFPSIEVFPPSGEVAGGVGAANEAATPHSVSPANAAGAAAVHSLNVSVLN